MGYKIKPLAWKEVYSQECRTKRRFIGRRFDGYTYSIRERDSDGKFDASLDMEDRECYLTEVRSLGTYDTLAQAQEAVQETHVRRMLVWLDAIEDEDSSRA